MSNQNESIENNEEIEGQEGEEATEEMTTAKPKTRAKVVKAIEIVPMRLTRVRVTIVGTSRLVTHRFSEKAQAAIIAKQMGLLQPRAVKEAKNPVEDFLGGLYVVEKKDTVYHEGEFLPEMLFDMEYGIPMPIRERTRPQEDQTPRFDALVEAKEGDIVEKVMVKTPAVVAYGTFGFPSVGLKQAIGTATTDGGFTKAGVNRNVRIPTELITIDSPTPPAMRVDMVRLAGPSAVADIRFRPDFGTEWRSTFEIQFDERILHLEHLITLLRRAGFSVGLGEWRMEKGGQWGTFDVDPKIEVLGTVETQTMIIHRESEVATA